MSDFTRGLMYGVIALVSLVVISLTTTACGSSTSTSTDGNSDGTGVAQVNLPDGRTVTCVTYDIYNGGGISCDWDNAK